MLHQFHISVPLVKSLVMLYFTYCEAIVCDFTVKLVNYKCLVTEQVQRVYDFCSI